MQELLVVCQCHSLDHMLQVSYDPDDPQLYVTIHLEPHRPWWKRVWRAITYVFGVQARFGDWDEFLLNADDVKNIRGILNRYDADWEKVSKTWTRSTLVRE